jgi:hypothetical protein
MTVSALCQFLAKIQVLVQGNHQKIPVMTAFCEEIRNSLILCGEGCISV